MKKILLFVGLLFVFNSCSKKPEAHFTWSPQNPKASQEMQFTNLSTDAKKYSWNLGDMNISSESSPKHTYKTAGNYIIDLDASRGLRTDQKTVTIIVIP